METNNLDPKDDSRRTQSSYPSGRVLGGMVIVVIGLIFLGHQIGLDLPSWLFTWPMIVACVGFYIGARNSFRPGGWMIAVAIGGVLTAEDIFYNFELRQYLWPAIVIGIGLFMIFRPRGSKPRWDSLSTSTDEKIDVTSVFSGTKKNIISKDFKGGSINNMFGGTDIDLTQADINGTVVLDVSSIFGGTKLVIPAHWNVRAETTVIFAAIEEKRHLTKAVDESKTLVLKGTIIFSGIDIKSH